jgi:hypothetical protein
MLFWRFKMISLNGDCIEGFSGGIEVRDSSASDEHFLSMESFRNYLRRKLPSECIPCETSFQSYVDLLYSKIRKENDPTLFDERHLGVYASAIGIVGMPLGRDNGISLARTGCGCQSKRSD